MQPFIPSYKLPCGIEYIEAAAKEGLPYAQWLFGNRYYLGQEVEKDGIAAIHWYEKSAHGGCAIAARTLAHLYETGACGPKRRKASLYFWHLAAERGDYIAIATLGKILLQNSSSAKARAKGRDYLQNSAYQGNFQSLFYLTYFDTQGHPPLLSPYTVQQSLQSGSHKNAPVYNYLLGLFYLQNTTSLQLDTERIQHYLTIAANSGYAPAQRDLGRLLMEGTILTKDYVNGIRWVYKAAKQNNGWAQSLLADYILNGLGTFSDLEAARMWYSRAVENGFPMAETSLLSLSITYSPNSESDAETIKKLILKAKFGNQLASNVLSSVIVNQHPAIKENPDILKDMNIVTGSMPTSAMKFISDLFLESSNEAPNKNYNPTNGLFWLQAAIEDGDPEAMFAMADQLIEGRHCRKNIALATALLHSAAHLGIPRAASRLAYITNFNNGLIQNMEYGATINEYAANNGDTVGAHNLAIQLRYGDGISPDDTLANYWQHKSAEARISTIFYDNETSLCPSSLRTNFKRPCKVIIFPKNKR